MVKRRAKNSVTHVPTTRRVAAFTKQNAKDELTPRQQKRTRQKARKQGAQVDRGRPYRPAPPAPKKRGK